MHGKYNSDEDYDLWGYTYIKAESEDVDKIEEPVNNQLVTKGKVQLYMEQLVRERYNNESDLFKKE